MEQLKLGATPAQILSRCQNPRLDPQSLDRLLADNLAYLRSGASDVDVSDFVAANFREVRPVNSFNHPGNFLMEHFSNRILAAMGFEPFARGEAAGTPELGENYMAPIYPCVIEHFGLRFVSPADRQPIFGEMKTWLEYMADYIEMR